MKFPHIFENVAALALLVVSLVATPAVTAQTIISNETLVSNHSHSQHKTRKGNMQNYWLSCKNSHVRPDQCHLPAATRKTCTSTFSWTRRLRSATFVTCAREAGADYFQFLVDDASPTIGPTDARGFYRSLKIL